ncbi:MULTISPECIES: hypothetical protein [unclassified Paraburkholderia]|uniref:hypothetical protein n=1 Tax=Paraburkholderia TaxID=1822464 RepID=UPI002158ED4D|nr:MULTISPECIES: hypothetical protein [unclassified Paraburkholderia]
MHLDWPDGKSTQLAPGLLGYALPHAVRRWPVGDAPAGASWATLRAVINGRAVAQKIVLQQQTTASASDAPTH